MTPGETRSYWRVQVYKPNGHVTWLTVNPHEAWRDVYQWNFGTWPAPDAYISSHEVTVTAEEIT